MVRPFSFSAKLQCRGYSRPLQRRIVDFGADVPFAKVPQKLKEHYGISIPVSMARQITQDHGARMALAEKINTEIPERKGEECVIAQIDGSMVPIVETVKSAEDDQCRDLRKHRELGWKEVRLALAHAKGSMSPVYATTFGGPDEAGDLLMDCAIRAGLGTKSRVHCVGDGASWIADQVSRVFASRANYLLDFYHVCEHLASAVQSCSPENKTGWLEEQKKNLKDGRICVVLDELKQSRDTDPDSEASPAGKCYDYLSKRQTQLDYQNAIAQDLPIGSGEVESGHRYIVQDRLKLPGAWWKKQNAQSMLSLRVCRANGGWDSYWASQRKQAA